MGRMCHHVAFPYADCWAVSYITKCVTAGQLDGRSNWYEAMEYPRVQEGRAVQRFHEGFESTRLLLQQQIAECNVSIEPLIVKR